MIRALYKLTTLILSLTVATVIQTNGNSKAIAFSVCGTQTEIATFKTKSYLVTICPGEASLQLILTYHDGTGYRKVPVQQEGNIFRGSEGGNNFIINNGQFIIGTDGEEPIRESIIESN